MAASSPQLNENLSLLHDPALADPASVPWNALGLGLALLLLAGLALSWQRRRRRCGAATGLPTPLVDEDALIALDHTWARASAANTHETITEMAAILRRLIGRNRSTDCTAVTTTELAQLGETADAALASLLTEFFEPADKSRFGGRPMKLQEAKELYDVARRYAVTAALSAKGSVA